MNPKIVMNYMITIFNTFGDAAVDILFEVADEVIWPEIISVVMILNRMPKDMKVTTASGIQDLTLYNVSHELVNSIREEMRQRR